MSYSVYSRSLFSKAVLSIPVLLIFLAGVPGIGVFSPLPVSAQEDLFEEEGLFEDSESMVEEEEDSGGADAPGTEEGGDPSAALLEEEEGIAWGGRFTFQGTSLWAWNETPGVGAESWAGPSQESLNPDISADLYFSARPNPDYRVYGKFKTSYPFAQEVNTGGETGGPAGSSASLEVPGFEIFELYSDFNWDERLFFRGGKQVITWGVGHFFSPADVISLSPIDPENPDQEREGPIALKGQLPWKSHNLYQYVLAKDFMFQDGGMSPYELAWAPKSELVLGGWEWGLGGYIQQDTCPRLMSTLTGSVGSVDLYGEAVGSWGSDRTYLLENGNTETRKDRPYFWGTGGFSWNRSNFGPGGSLAAAGQYLYNGDGYRDSELYAAARMKLAAGSLAPGDIRQFGRHYGAFSVGWSDIAESSLGAKVFCLGNLSDSSGTAQLRGSWEFFEGFKLSAGPTFLYGGDQSETVLSAGGNRFLLEIALTAGSGSF